HPLALSALRLLPKTESRQVSSPVSVPFSPNQPRFSLRILKAPPRIWRAMIVVPTDRRRYWLRFPDHHASPHSRQPSYLPILDANSQTEWWSWGLASLSNWTAVRQVRIQLSAGSPMSMNFPESHRPRPVDPFRHRCRYSLQIALSHQIATGQSRLPQPIRSRRLCEQRSCLIHL